MIRVLSKMSKRSRTFASYISLEKQPYIYSCVVLGPDFLTLYPATIGCTSNAMKDSLNETSASMSDGLDYNMNEYKPTDRAAVMMSSVLWALAREGGKVVLDTKNGPFGPRIVVNAATSKYDHLLTVIEELGKDVKPTYTGNKVCTERLKRNIVHARILIRETLLEAEKDRQKAAVEALNKAQ